MDICDSQSLTPGCMNTSPVMTYDRMSFMIATGKNRHSQVTHQSSAALIFRLKCPKPRTCTVCTVSKTNPVGNIEMNEKGIDKRRYEKHLVSAVICCYSLTAESSTVQHRFQSHVDYVFSS